VRELWKKMKKYQKKIKIGFPYNGDDDDEANYVGEIMKKTIDLQFLCFSFNCLMYF
jgi:hypothetical protein